ncbi:MAG: response regulator [Candidatus Omnitrophica bacterium]|nr:response regulator [Candidatus Omnitrophota bacterium]
MARKILIVDDEPNIVKVLESRLKSQGYDIIIAGDGQTGLEAFQKYKPDLVILDVMLPKKDGYQVCRELKSTPTGENTPVVMLTAKGEVEDMQSGLEKGADVYITKPFDSESLIGIVKGLLQGD